MTARSIVDHCAHPWDLTNDIGTNESAHLEIISQSGIPNGEIIAATQSASICYAPCYAIRPLNALGVHFAIQNFVRIAQTIWQKMNLWLLLTVCNDRKFNNWPVGVVEATSSSLVTQTISSVHNESDEHSIFFCLYFVVWSRFSALFCYAVVGR